MGRIIFTTDVIHHWHRCLPTVKINQIVYTSCAQSYKSLMQTFDNVWLIIVNRSCGEHKHGGNGILLLKKKKVLDENYHTGFHRFY